MAKRKETAPRVVGIFYGLVTRGVFEMGGDPIALGLVTNLNHPGGNITGATLQNVEVNPKRLELLHQVMPTAAEFGLLVNPTNPASAETSIKLVKTAADALGL